MPVDPTTGTDPDRTLRATDGWNRLNKAIAVTLPRQLARSQRARLKLRKLR